MYQNTQQIRYSCASDVGRVRQVNQDNFACDGIYMEMKQKKGRFSISGETKPPGWRLFGVFDGLGGEECGEVAAYLAAKDAVALQQNEYSEQDLKRLCFQSNQKICRYAEDNELNSMGTTAALLAFSDSRIILCNIGDSKIFRFDGTSLKQLSVDHLAQAPVGRKQPLSQNLGIPADVMIIDPCVKTLEYHKDDVYIICSDGLTDMVGIEDMWKILQETDVSDLAGTLVDRALENGGRDNVTVVAVKREERVC